MRRFTSPSTHRFNRRISEAAVEIKGDFRTANSRIVLLNKAENAAAAASISNNLMPLSAVDPSDGHERCSYS